MAAQKEQAVYAIVSQSVAAPRENWQKQALPHLSVRFSRLEVTRLTGCCNNRHGLLHGSQAWKKHEEHPHSILSHSHISAEKGRILGDFGIHNDPGHIYIYSIYPPWNYQ